MATIKHRRFGRERGSSRALGASHIIKIGFDARRMRADKLRAQNRSKAEIDKTLAHAFPGKLPGFLLCIDSYDAKTGGNLVDMEAMEALGYSAEQIEQAKREQLAGGSGLLPQILHFVLLANAQQTADGWQFPRTIEEEFEFWDKSGLACHGDGCTAWRKAGQGIRQEIVCAPIGRSGIEDASQFCPHSVDRECKPHMRLTLCLYRPTDDGPVPLSATLGAQAIYRLDTSSEYAAIEAHEKLVSAADRLNGWIGGLTGALTFSKKQRRYEDKEGKGGLSIVGHVSFSLNEYEIQLRERQLRASAAGLDAPRPSLQIAAPAPAAGQPVDVIDHVAPPAQPAEPADPVEVGDADLAALLAAHVEAIRRASAEELVGALVDCIARQACDRDMEFQASWEAACTYEVKGETYIVPDAEWFSAAPDERKAAARVRILRSICEQLAADPDSGWMLGQAEAMEQ